MRKIVVAYFASITLITMGCLSSYAGELISKHIPETLPVKADVEFRYRLEARDNFDFNNTKDDENIFHLYRTRLNLDIQPMENVRSFIQLQDARIGNSEFASRTAFEDPMDIRQTYLELSGVADGIIDFRVGRQELAYGQERLIGGFNWSNVAQTFDAAKMHLNFKERNFWTDLFWSRKVVIDDTDANSWDRKDEFIGAYSSWKGLEDHAIEMFLLGRLVDRLVVFGPNVGAQDMDEGTFGGRICGKGPLALDYELEGAYQFGNFGPGKISAYALVGVVGFSPELPWKPRFAFEWDHASGDDDSGDNSRGTFDNLFPTNHLHYGYMDRASLQNIDDLRFQIAVKPAEGLQVQADAHLLYLDTVRDSLYSAGRAALRTATHAGVSDEVGQELDVLTKYKVNEYLGILAGYSHFFAGDFISQTGASDDGDFFYLQLTAHF
jgi:hypothetical protein